MNERNWAYYGDNPNQIRNIEKDCAWELISETEIDVPDEDAQTDLVQFLNFALS